MGDKELYNINDIADYVIGRIKLEDENAVLTNIKLQKLLYYIQAWSLAIRGRKMFDGDFQAWIHGPVNREIFDRFKNEKTLYSEIELSDRKNISFCPSEEDADFIEYILENYARLSSSQLEQMTHSEKPWQEARKGFEPMQRCEKIISTETMRIFYGKKWAELKS